MSSFYLPDILYAIPRNSVTAMGLPLALGILSGSRTAKVVRSPWYKSLAVPPGRPPRQVFPIVWPILYLSMGYASHLAVRALDLSSNTQSRSALNSGLALYYAQLLFNFSWSLLFFNAKQLGIALVDSILLAGTTYYMTALWDGPSSSKTTYCLLPYCAWLTFATYLNGGIWWLNRGKAGNSTDKHD